MAPAVLGCATRCHAPLSHLRGRVVRLRFVAIPALPGVLGDPRWHRAIRPDTNLPVSYGGPGLVMKRIVRFCWLVGEL